MFYSTKTYGHEVGFSCAFRQPKATHSHCSKLHGYSLGFKFVFGAHAVDENGWVVDFGNLKALKQKLADNFDHKTCVSASDPYLIWYKDGQGFGVLDLNIMNRGVGCEAFALYAFEFATEVIADIYKDGRVWVVSCECSEHGANSSIYQPTTEFQL